MKPDVDAGQNVPDFAPVGTIRYPVAHCAIHRILGAKTLNKVEVNSPRVLCKQYRTININITTPCVLQAI